MKKILILILCFLLLCTPTYAEETVNSNVILGDPTIELIVPVPKTVTIYCSRERVMTENETVLLWSEISGFEGCEVHYQWMCDKGNGYEPVEGATNDVYGFPATVESLSWNWQLIVYYREE